MKRVAIIGSPGTGKSTFARKLAQRVALPLVHLDFYYHDARLDYHNNKAAWRTRANEFAAGESWIIDGNFGATMSERLQRADTIFYFDMPTYVALRGIMRRWFARNTSRPDVPDDWQEKPSLAFLWKVLSFRHHYAAGTRQLLAQNANKTIIVFKNHAQIAEYLARN